MKRRLRIPFLIFFILSASMHGTVLALLAAPHSRVLVSSQAISVKLAAPENDGASIETRGPKPKPAASQKPAPGGGSGEQLTPVTALLRPQAPQAATGLASLRSRETVTKADGKRTAGPEMEKPPTDSEAIELSEQESERRRRNLARTLVSEALRAHLNYPLLARKHGWQGRVRLRLQIVDNGRITGIHLVQSSGYGVLDRAALQSLSQVAKLNPLSSWPLLHDLDIVIPVEYRLLDS